MTALTFQHEGKGIVLFMDRDEQKQNRGFKYKAIPPETQDGFVRYFHDLQEAIAYAKGGTR